LSRAAPSPDPPSDPLDWLDRLARVRVLVVGDVMLDRFVHGTVDRISPEGPIGILRVRRQHSMLGGAGNVARNLAALGVRASLVGVAGRDEAGGELRRLLAGEAGIGGGLVTEPGRITTIKTRYIGGAQQLLRADWESEAKLAPATRHKLLARALRALQRCQVLVLSDYGKGVLGGDIAARLIRAARRAGKTVLVDPKGGDHGRYEGASLVTPNQRELAEASFLPVDSDAAVEKAARRLIARHRIGAVLATRSSRGMTLVSARDKPVHIRAEAREVFDVAGAGDTVIAAVAAAVGAGAPLAMAALLGNEAAGLVVGKVGTATVSLDELRMALSRRRARQGEAKLVSLEQAMTLAARWRRGGLRIGFTNGCFDLLHPGHVGLLRQARAACDRLIVGLNSDRSVRRLKGAGRPVQRQQDRAALLGSLSDVDAVVIFAQDTPLALIEALRPDLLVKGADYREAEVVGARLVRGYGGRVMLARLSPGHSTTGTIGRLRSTSPPLASSRRLSQRIKKR
jgi:D-beta-D-heptose 7-phosphate kinase/D-beta-D-heptose 1-phosphate adenosyltransferase